MRGEGTHEIYRRETPVVGPSNRSFGLLFCIVFAIAGLLPLWNDGSPRVWALAVSLAFCVAAIALPRILTPLNRLWLKLGLGMHRVVNPMVMAVLFYVAVTPFGLVMRLFHKGLVRRLRPDAAAPTYWISRDSHPASRMDQQF